MEQRHFQEGSVKLYVLALYAFQKKNCISISSLMSISNSLFLFYPLSVINQEITNLLLILMYRESPSAKIVLDKTVEYNVIPINCYWCKSGLCFLSLLVGGRGRDCFCFQLPFADSNQIAFSPVNGSFLPSPIFSIFYMILTIYLKSKATFLWQNNLITLGHLW